MSLALVWFRRDLRLADNPALDAALDHYDQVLPVYVHDPGSESPWTPGAASDWWLHHALAGLDHALREAGACLLLRSGDAGRELASLVAQTGAEAVFWNRLYEPALIARDRRIKATLRGQGVEAQSFAANLLVEPFALQTGDGGPYRVFTPFWKRASAELQTQLASGRAPLPAPAHVPLPAKLPDGIPLAALGLLPRIAWDQGFHAIWTPGAPGVASWIEDFLDEGLGSYARARDLPAVRGTSRLSAALHFGECSPLQVVARIRARGDEGGAFVRELGWREFAHHLLYHYPESPDAPLNERFKAFPWRRAGDYAGDLEAWKRGRTGVPIVDAGMRELWTTGWMHNRVRMIVASFLTKNLRIPWQEGARWFWDTLVDADLANNTLGWQWVAGSGADAAPYFRIFNPVLQSRKFDAAGAYLRRWVPEIAALSDRDLHAPWEAAASALSEAGIVIGRHYPAPIVDLKTSREAALAAYQEIKGA